ncbi:hypothetical protein L7F22_057804 [Adiantum nelumboides]|nr:hypothetical protein [Adiantum nelumboides]
MDASHGFKQKEVKRSMAEKNEMRTYDEKDFWRHEVLLLRDRMFHLKNFERYMLGENLLPLNLGDIQRVGNRLEVALNKVRVKKVQLLQGQMQEMCKKEARLQEENKVLKMKLVETTTQIDMTKRMLTRGSNGNNDGLCNGRQEPSWLQATSMNSPTMLMQERECPSIVSSSLHHHHQQQLPSTSNSPSPPHSHQLHLGLELFSTKLVE